MFALLSLGIVALFVFGAPRASFFINAFWPFVLPDIHPRAELTTDYYKHGGREGKATIEQIRWS
jgi:hypothetical protein